MSVVPLRLPEPSLWERCGILDKRFGAGLRREGKIILECSRGHRANDEGGKIEARFLTHG